MVKYFFNEKDVIDKPAKTGPLHNIERARKPIQTG